MARITEPTPEQLEGWKAWVDSRPHAVRLLGERFDPWTLYLLTPTGQRVTIASFFEDGTLSVSVTREFNEAVGFERVVFGIEPDELEECDLPVK